MDNDKFLIVHETESIYGTETKVEIVTSAVVTVNSLFTTLVTDKTSGLLFGTLELRTLSGNLISRHENNLPPLTAIELTCNKNDQIFIKNIYTGGKTGTVPILLKVNDDYYIAINCRAKNVNSGGMVNNAYGQYINRTEWGFEGFELLDLLTAMHRQQKRDWGHLPSYAGVDMYPPHTDWMESFRGFIGQFYKVDSLLAREFIENTKASANPHSPL